MFSKGSVAVKIAGRDNGVCVILEKKEGKLLVVGPEVRKRWVNPAHLEPLNKTLDVKLEEKKLFEELDKIQGDFKKAIPDFLSLTSLRAKMKR